MYWRTSPLPILSVAQLVAFETGRDPGKVEPYRVRPPVKPVTIGQMAALDEGEEA